MRKHCRIYVKIKLGHVLKFVSFVQKNNDVPFVVKRRVFDAALMSSLLYGCESWVGADLKPVIKLYNWALKQLLGVRKSTPNIVCYAEAGYPSLPDIVRVKQHKFYSKMASERSNLIDDPLIFTIDIVTRANTPTGRIISDFIKSNIPGVADLMQNVYSSIIPSGIAW